MAMTETFCLETIRARLDGHPWADNILFFDSIGSTNTHAKALAAAGAPHGTVLIADHQTDGRGRLGRRFLSPGGTGIYLSLILRPGCGPQALMHLTCAAAVAMCDAVRDAVGIRPGIKWTNDLVWERKKLAGILTELSLSGDGSVQSAVVGIGINCCQSPEDFDPEIRDTATSLSIITGQSMDRSQIAAAMIRALSRMNDGLLREKASIMDAYRRDCVTIGQEVSVHSFDQVRHGRALDIHDDGALMVQFPDGHIEDISAGEVSVRGMYGYV